MFPFPGLSDAPIVLPRSAATGNTILSGGVGAIATWGKITSSHVDSSIMLSGTVPTAIVVANESTDTTCFPLFVTAATGNLEPKTSSQFLYNSQTGSARLGTCWLGSGGSTDVDISAQLGDADNTSVTINSVGYNGGDTRFRDVIIADGKNNVIVFIDGSAQRISVIDLVAIGTINKITITAPATSATLTIANGKTLTANNTLTFSGTDSSTLDIGAGGTLGTAAYTASSSYQPVDATLTAFAALTIAANSLTIGSGVDAFNQTTFAANTFPARASTGSLVAKAITDFGLSLIDDADASAARSTLGLGTLSTQSGTFSGTSSGTNTGDNATNSQYSGLVTNANHTGDATGDAALTVKGINGTLLSSLATGILKNTTTTGVPSIAVAGDFPTLNQNTTGSAATLTTTRTIGGSNFNGSANVTSFPAPGAIGGTTPSTIAATSLACPTFTSSAAMGFTPAAGSGINFSLTTTGDFAVNTNQLYVDTSTGNVGIGTTSPNYKSTIDNSSGNYFASALLSASIGTSGNWVGQLYGYTGNTYQKAATIFESSDSYGRGKFYIALNDATNSGNVSISDAKLTVDYNGNVGIGTPSPGARMDVVENIRISRVTSGNNMDLDFYSPQGYPGVVAKVRVDGDGTANYFGALSFWTGRLDTGSLTERMRIMNNGNVGIGITAPTALLHLGASTTARASLCIPSGTAPTSPVAGDIWYDGTNLKFRDGGTTRTLTWV